MQFPRLAILRQPDLRRAGARRFATTLSADEPAKLVTYTADWLSYNPAPPLHVGFVQFESGARLLMEIVDVGQEGIAIGMPLRAVFRIKERDRRRGYNRYFWKMTPVETANGAT